MSSVAWLVLEILVVAMIAVMIGTVLVEAICGVNCARMLEALVLGHARRDEANLCDRAGASAPSPQHHVTSSRRRIS